ncbi:glycosyltransferase, partial [Sphaerisporangium sp. NPDC049002]
MTDTPRTPSTTRAGDRPVIRHNDYSTLVPPPLGEWTPGLPVSVVIPAHGGQRRLDLTLAALAAQTYPSGLMEVVVVDDGSEPPLRLPEIRP